jgi:alpha-glucosidase
VEEYEAALPQGGWPNWVLGNHDQPRIASRIGEARARVAAMLLLTLRGTPTMYYGDEIGLQNVPIPPERVQDPWEKNEPGLGLGRDPCRTPMQWTAGANAGFSDDMPWLPLSGDHEVRNVATLGEDTQSILTLYRRLIALRRQHPALSIGDYVPAGVAGDVFWFERRHEETRFIVALNFGHDAATMRLRGDARVLLSTHLDRADEPVRMELRLRSDEGVVLVV